MTWIKICGITNLEDAQAAVEAGADALGFVFYEKSPRRVDAETVREIVKHLPERVERVGVFVDAPRSRLGEIAEHAGLTHLQLHKIKSQMGWQNFIEPGSGSIEIIVAVPGQTFENGGFLIATEFAKKVHAVMVDSGSPDAPGGTGVPFDWHNTRGMIRGISSDVNLIVAGGLNPSNVADAMRILQPWGVDVSSGVESHPGKKDLTKMRAFVDAVREADRLQ